METVLGRQGKSAKDVAAIMDGSDIYTLPVFAHEPLSSFYALGFKTAVRDSSVLTSAPFCVALSLFLFFLLEFSCSRFPQGGSCSTIHYYAPGSLPENTKIDAPGNEDFHAPFSQAPT